MAPKQTDRTWWAFEFERAVWTSLGEWKYFIWKANNDDVTRGFLINIHDVGKAPQQILLSDWTDIGDVITLWDTHWWCNHFMLSGPEMFPPIFLQFSPKTRLTKYDHWWLFYPKTAWPFQGDKMAMSLFFCKTARPLYPLPLKRSGHLMVKQTFLDIISAHTQTSCFALQRSFLRKTNDMKLNLSVPHIFEADHLCANI